MTALPLQLPVKNGVLILAKLFVVGIGPGEYEQMTIKAVNTIKNCPVIAGYTVYCDLIKKYFPEKEYILQVYEHQYSFSGKVSATRLCNVILSDLAYRITA